MMTKYIFITGGVVSSLGKGIIAASLGKLLRARGFSVINQKFDPYINVDPGTMSPFQHGEVFVTDDGAETDLDLGHYERFTDTALGKFNNVTSGSVYQTVIEKERRVVKNIILFIDIIFTKVQYDGRLDPSIKNTYTLPKSIEIAYSAINYGETRDYFKMASFPNNMDGKNIISTILKSVDPDYQVMIM